MIRPNTLAKAAVVAVASYLGASIAATGVDAAEITILCSANIRPAVEAVIPAFERASGHKVMISYVSVPALTEQINNGAKFDMAVAFTESMDRILKAGKLVGGSRFEIVRSGIGGAVRTGAPKPDIGSTDALKNSLLAAKSVAFSKGPTGVYLATVMEQLGIAEQLKPKTVMAEPGLGSVGTLVAKGEVEIGIHGIYELVPVVGIVLVGPIPAELQKMMVYSAMIPPGAKEPEAAKALARFFSSETAIPLLKTQGMEP
jgi:molybdate transport system substrate-binding protein